ncbi:hypothetical protein FRC06_009636 [Ceratobasidium sp. 370]|nr:hypothetical protein FRC06_009636 [Ceratobasidium sp. 370]
MSAALRSVFNVARTARLTPVRTAAVAASVCVEILLSSDRDLERDSLDAVEAVMAIEEEFSIEIPDAEADEIKTVHEGK